MQPKSSTDTPPADEPFLLEEFLPYELSVAANRASRLFARRYSEAFGLSIAEWRVMAMVGRFGTISPGAVAERAEMDKVKVSRAVASLVAAGLAEQGPDPQDGRARLLRLTRKGRHMHQDIVPLARTLEAQLAAGLSADEWAALRNCLRKLYAHVRRLDAAEPRPKDGKATRLPE
ncbi:MarR family winged helix-turn-helix transcriptional regulator [Limobrevibacterium gyesilva]|uniref:MarR family winged helix-turn-helix transcriptional regulator n=1 Tax=Limobrevibacterium gyesilva TaxID=2991712 RepID=A0AA42CGW4_9PROT|nr:MarR family winged helix-turn-helix transcriptional regulator [Limobrevibacterium gyesilva]MCW3476536.1 MarR family winged helix-turn-helix transcriptional regulator [Limobrevibacterium gyesilva]